MSALTASRNTPRQGQEAYRCTLPMKAAAKIFKGSMVAVDATGFVVDPTTATGLIAMGVSLQDVDNTSGGNGALSVDVGFGVYSFNNLGGDLVVQASAGSDCFITDDNTVSKTNGGATKSRAGKVVRIDANGQVWVLFPGPGL